MSKKCNECGQFKLYTHAKLARIIGSVAAPLGLFLIWIPIVGLMLLLIGIALFFGSFVPAAKKRHICLNCNYKD